MNILVLNCGSSSVKYKLIEIKANKVLAEGGIEKISLPDAFIKFKFGNEKIQQDLDINDHVGAIKNQGMLRHCPTPQSCEHGRHRRHQRSAPRSATSGRVRHSVPPNHASKILHVCPSI